LTTKKIIRFSPGKYFAFQNAKN